MSGAAILRLAPDEVACVADRYGYPRHVAHQFIIRSPTGTRVGVGPLALDQGVGAIVWSPLGWES